MDDRLKDIYNYRQLNENLATAGQPSAEELRFVADAGFEVVINLGLSDQGYSIADERGLVRSLGLEYIHIPVRWERPRDRDFGRFAREMKTHANRRIFVHCAANKRVSVFVALYRVCHLGWPLEEAMRELRAIWEPDSVWSDFIQAQLSRLGSGA